MVFVMAPLVIAMCTRFAPAATARRPPPTTWRNLLFQHVAAGASEPRRFAALTPPYSRVIENADRQIRQLCEDERSRGDHLMHLTVIRQADAGSHRQTETLACLDHRFIEAVDRFGAMIFCDRQVEGVASAQARVV